MGYLITNFRACGIIEISCQIFAFENRSYIVEFEEVYKKALVRESGAQRELFNEKKLKIENLVTLAL
jgi:hypothetical protein